MDVLRARQLLDEGADYQSLNRQVRAGELKRLRHGAYTVEQPGDQVQRHRALVAGTWPLISSEAVLSHASAAVLHGLPVPDGSPGVVEVTRAIGGHGRIRPSLRVHFGRLADSDVVEAEGMVLTSLERTAADVARASSYERAVAVLDAALHLGGNPEAMVEVLARQRRWHGIATARRASAFADGRAESVGESISRVRIAQAWLPAPELQFAVFSAAGVWLARCDFAWPSVRVIGEFDGRVKYLGTPQEVAATVMAEKACEQAIRDAGWTVVRWGWSELSGPSAFTGPLRRALAAGGLAAHH